MGMHREEWSVVSRAEAANNHGWALVRDPKLLMFDKAFALPAQNQCKRHRTYL